MDINIRVANSDDATAVNAMLSRLADEIGDSDVFACDVDAISRHGFGDKPIIHFLIAENRGDDLGLAAFFPLFSTTRGKSGVYVQDLWIGTAARGQGLGTRLLAEVVKHAVSEWRASYLKLTVYAENSAAREFYQRLEFQGDERELPVTLEGAAFNNLRERA
jgi:ribosomal protein S18 acetylase RimI-like enzyme